MKPVYLKTLSILFFFFAIVQTSAAQSANWYTPVGQDKVFIENKGQYDNLYGLPAGKVLYAIEDGTNHILFTAAGVSFRFDKIEKKNDEQELREKEMNHVEREKLEKEIGHEIELINMQWAGATGNVVVEASDKVSEYYNYGMGQKSISNVPAYKKITYKNVYPGIDVEYVLHPQTGIKYSLILHPGADVSQFKMLYTGANGISIDANDNVLIPSMLGNIIDNAPVTYYRNDEQTIIKSSYVKNGNTISFQLGSYDNTKEVVVDPWTVVPSFPNSNKVWEVETDSSGNVYAYAGDMPIALRKYNSAGTLQWTYSNATWDSANYWIGGVLTHPNGESYMFTGSNGEIRKISPAGTQVWYNNPNSLTAYEYWGLAFSCDFSRLFCGGSRAQITNIQGTIMEINMANGSLGTVAVVGYGSVVSFPPSIQEVSSLCVSPNGNIYFLTLDTVGSIAPNLSTINFKIPTGYGFDYYIPGYGFGTKQPISATRATCSALYTRDGTTISRRNLSNGAVINTANIPGGITNNNPLFGTKVNGCGGLDIDSCGNVYVGAGNQVHKFDASLNLISSANTPSAVYDVDVNSNGEVVACGQSFVASVNLNACRQRRNICANPVFNPVVVQPSCTANNGSVTMTIANGVGPYQWQWSNGSTTNVASNLGPGPISVTVTDVGTTCQKDTTLILSIASTLNVQINNITQPTCADGDGSATVVLSGGQAPYNTTFTYNGSTNTVVIPAATSQAIPNLNAGPITITVIDGQGCRDTAITTLSLPANCCPIVVTYDSLNVTCNGGNNGWIDLDVSPTSGTYNYQWSPNVGSTDSVFGLSAGLYNVTVSTPGVNTTATDTLFFETFEAGTANWALNTGTGTNQWVRNAIYPGGACTVIFLPLFTVPAVPNEPAGVTAGPTSNYLHIRSTVNNNGCNAPWPPLNANFDDTEVSTQHTAMANNISTVGYTNVRFQFYWLGMGNSSCYGSVQYSTNNGGTWTNVGTNLFNGANWALNTITNAAFDNQATLRFRFVWTNGSGGSDPAFSVDEVRILGDHSVTSGACQKVYHINLTQPQPVNVSVNTTQPTCAVPTGSATATATGGNGGFTYAWNTVPAQNTATATNLAPNTYTVTATDIRGCTGTANATLSAPVNCCNFVMQPVITQPTCAQSNGSVVMGITNGSSNYSFNWSNGSVVDSAVNLAAGTISVTVTDNGQACQQDTILTLNSNSTLGIAFSGLSDPTCLNGDGSVVITVNGGTPPFQITLDTGALMQTTTMSLNSSIMIVNIPDGVFTVTVVDSEGCQAISSLTFNLPTNCCTFTVAANLTQPNCGVADGAIALTTANGSGNYSYAWASGPVTSGISNVPAGTYVVTVTDNAYPNCFIDTSFALSNPNAPVINSVNITNETCPGTNDGAATVNASGGTGALGITWSNSASTFTINSLAEGNYTFTVTDAANCQNTGNANVQAGLCCTLHTVASATATTCGLSNGSITVTADTAGILPYMYAINGGTSQPSGVFNNLAGGNYTIVTTDSAGCTDTVVVTVPASSNTLAVTVATVDVSCFGFNDGSVTASTTGGSAPVNFLWSTTATTPTINNLPIGTYTVTATDGNGCTATALGTLTEPAGLVFSLGNDVQVCEGAPVTIDAGAGYTAYLWSNGATSQSINTNTANTYSVTVTNANGCTATDAMNVAIIPTPQVDLGADEYAYEGTDVNLFANVNTTSNTGTYNWQPDTYLSCNNCQNPTADAVDTIEYIVTYTDADGCVNSDSITLFILPVTEVVFPNAFTPNNDGRNDWYLPIGSTIKTIQLSIFNRWGEKVFETFDEATGWDGNYKGKQAPAGVYIYTADVTLYNNASRKFKGSITLIR
jgi:gliding motility-associated-like protein